MPEENTGVPVDKCPPPVNDTDDIPGVAANPGVGENPGVQGNGCIRGDNESELPRGRVRVGAGVWGGAVVGPKAVFVLVLGMEVDMPVVEAELSGVKAELLLVEVELLWAKVEIGRAHV